MHFTASSANAALQSGLALRGRRTNVCRLLTNLVSSIGLDAPGVIPVTTPLDLFPALEKRLREQARPQKRGSLPRLRDSSLETARDWLEALEQFRG